MMYERRNRRGAVILLAGVALFALFAGMGVREIESGDETRVAGIAAEMFLNRNFLVPSLNGAPFLEYPPLYYWMIACAYSLFGICDFAAKFPSLVAAFGMVLLTFAFARKLKFSIPEAFCSGIVLLFSAQFFAESRTCRVDMLLAFFIELSLFAFYAMMRAGELKHKFGYGVLFIAGLAGGIYTKGLVGLVLPGAAIGSWLVAADFSARKFHWKRYAALFAGVVLAFGAAFGCVVAPPGAGIAVIHQGTAGIAAALKAFHRKTALCGHGHHTVVQQVAIFNVVHTALCIEEFHMLLQLFALAEGLHQLLQHHLLLPGIRKGSLYQKHHSVPDMP